MYSICLCCFVYGKYRIVVEVLMVLCVLSVVFSLLACIVFVSFCRVFKSASHKMRMLEMQRMRFGTNFPFASSQVLLDREVELRCNTKHMEQK